MSLVTAAAAAAFGLMLATIAKSRAQLNGISTVVILVMSALGGSMVPRFVMPDFMNTTALFTFNGWALDGYLKIFWYERPGGDPGAVAPRISPATRHARRDDGRLPGRRQNPGAALGIGLALRSPT